MDQLEIGLLQSKQILPYEGEAIYEGVIFKPKECEALYQALMKEVEWKNDEAIIFGKKIITKRKVAWYADQPFSYVYSKVTKVALPWIPLLKKLKERVEEVSGETFNSCLLNLYHSGEEGMAWHSDDEKMLVEKGAIASLTFGAERRFSFKNKETKERISLILENGSLLMMKGETQENWLHRLPPTKTVSTPRINLTFRQMLP